MVKTAVSAPNAERQGDNGNEREAGSFGESADGIANILPPRFEIREAPQVAAGFFQRRRIANLALRLRWVAGCFGFHFQMEAQLVFQIAVQLTAAPQRVKTF
jgi:hypothetical protein